MIRIQRQYHLRFTLKSGRQLTEWVSEYTVTFSRSAVTGVERKTVPGTLPEIIRFDFSEFAAVELIDRRWRLRIGRTAA